MGRAHRIIGYLAGALAASLGYMAWLEVVFLHNTPTEGRGSLSADLAFLLLMWLVGGMAGPIALLAVLWPPVVIGSRRVQHWGGVYFSLLGAVLTLVLGCVASSLAPKPLFVEDQTFFEGFRIAFERQGICFLLCGLVFGLTYWLLSERLRQAPFVESA